MATKVKSLDIAIAEAERFLSAAKSFRKGARQHGDTKNPWLEGGALAAHTKRASKDLSRALAKIRVRRLRLTDVGGDKGRPCETVKSVLKRGLRGLYDDEAVDYILRHGLKYYLSALELKHGPD